MKGVEGMTERFLQSLSNAIRCLLDYDPFELMVNVSMSCSFLLKIGDHKANDSPCQ